MLLPERKAILSRSAIDCAFDVEDRVDAADNRSDDGEVRSHPGVETQRQSSDLAIVRTTPILLGLYSRIALWTKDLLTSRSIVMRAAAWYRKDVVTFSDALAAVRRQIWTNETLSMSPNGLDLPEVPLQLLDRLTELACYAA